MDFSETQNKKPFKIPNHLSTVHQNHLPSLHGFQMRYCAIPDGACLTNCLTAHISCTDDEEERRINNRRVNHHIADNFDKYYVNKIALPYIETVGVGQHKRKVKCTTREEFLSFLRSEDSLCAFSNYQEIQAIANMLNITVNIFTYGIGGDVTRFEWREVGPDSEMADTAHFPRGWIPDMHLYNSDQNHYDLLVSRDHRLALLGLIQLKKSSTKDNPSKQDKISIISEETFLQDGKQSGHRRTSPLNAPESLQRKPSWYSCNQCEAKLESNGLLIAHMQSHSDGHTFTCDDCEITFSDKMSLENHRQKDHSNSVPFEDWNCNDCSYQGHEAHILLKHLKITGHQPSRLVEKRKIYSDYKECYTCKEEFDGYFNLMSHRKIVHPSEKKCRNFPANCKFEKECWYVHDELMETGDSKESSENVSWAFNCHLCEEKFVQRRDFMNHKKTNHEDKVNVCNNFINGNCSRNDESCWYKHQLKIINSPPQDQDFQKAQGNSVPPNHLLQISQILANLLSKVEFLEKSLLNKPML